MSFVCEMCGDYSGPRERPVSITVETADATYSEREYFHNGKRVWDRGGKGFEIVAQKQVCKPCHAQFMYELRMDVGLLREPDPRHSKQHSATLAEIASGLEQLLAMNE